VKRLRALAGVGPGSSRITFRGWVVGSDRIKLLQRASLFALPSYQENFGIAMVEALAAGVPVMVTPGVNLGADIEAAGAGWVVSRDGSVWRHALLAVTNDDNGLRSRGSHARDYAKRFHWSAIANSLRDLYEDLINRPVVAVRA
jgi:glycosyltransferase involved in cell wall biosynthesis